MKILLFIFFLNTLFCFSYQAPIDTVFWFYPGKGQNFGQDSTYFPMNIFNLPDTNASENIPSANPKNICSIGLGGEICVGFKNYYVYDGEGEDFTIFENAFINPITKKVFAEPAVVSVSEDGVNFYEFPWDYYTLQGCAGTKPTNGKANPFDPKVSGGNSFDLAVLGLKKIRYIKIKDICDTILKSPNHPYYDPVISGFDLDCVVGLNLTSLTDFAELPLENHYLVKSYKTFLNIHSEKEFLLQIYDACGKLLLSVETKSDNYEIDLSKFHGNIFFGLIMWRNTNAKFTHFKILKLNDELFIN